MPAYYVPISIGTDLLLLAIFTGLSLRFVRFNTLRPPLQLLGACGFGLLLFSYLLFALGQFSLLKTPVFLSVLVLLACFAYRPVRDLLPSSTYRLTLPDFQSIEKVLLALILLVALFNFLFGFAPPTGDDELAYHISLPVLYIKMGTMVNVPTLLQSYFYLNGELLYTGVLLLRDIFAVKAMVWLSGLLVVWALYYFAREHLRFERKYALLAVALAYTCPMMTSLHGTTSSDLFNLFLTLVSANLYWEWRQTKSRKLLVLMAVLGGAAIGFRNYAVNWVIPMMAVILLLDRRPLDAFLFGFIAVCVFSPWPIRDFILTGNPFYPSAYWASAATDPYHLAMRPEFTPKTFLKSLALAPYFLAGGTMIWDFGLAPVLLAPFAWLKKDPSGVTVRLSALAIFGIVMTHFIPWAWMCPRYYGSTMPWLVFLAVKGLIPMFEAASSKARTLVSVWLGALLLFPNIALSAYFGGKRIPYFLGFQSEEQYLVKQYAGDEGYDMMQYILKEINPQFRLLDMGDVPCVDYYYYHTHSILPMSQFAPPMYKKDTPALAKMFRDNDIRYLLVCHSQFRKELDGKLRFITYPKVDTWLPPLTAPYFVVQHETNLATLYSVEGPR